MLDSICAPATPLLPSAISIVRASGVDLVAKLQPLIKLPASRQASTRILKWNNYQEQALVIFFKGPNSYTGEDVVEFQLHGNPLLVKRFIEHLGHLGIRSAKPGEFTKRALLNGKQNLLEVEALRDLINSTTDAQLRQAQARAGGLPIWIQEVKNVLASWLAIAEADVDYGEENNIVLDLKDLQSSLIPLRHTLNKEYQRALAASWILNGIRIALVGRPNAGKSTLFNTISGIDQAIVTNIPGTTRDVLETQVEWSGLPLLLYDTAGLRNSENYIEGIGISKVYNVLEQADLILHLVPITDIKPDAYVTEYLKPFMHKVTVIRNQSDLDVNIHCTEPCISAINGDLDALTKVIQEKFLNELTPDLCLGAMATRRQQEILNELITQIEMLLLLKIGSPAELIASMLQGAWGLLTDLTGEDRADSTMDWLFSKFCLGK